MPGTPKTVGPLALTTTYTSNIYQGGGGSALIRDRLRGNILIANKTTSACKFRLYKGATGANAAGTEMFYDVSVPANTTVPYWVDIELNSADYLVGGAEITLSLTIEFTVEQEVVYS